jgi:hypothetical protein
MSQQITITAHSLRALVDPVLPCASVDGDLPVLNAVKIEARGKWLMAMATDRFKLGLKRVKAPADEQWAEFQAVVSVRALKSILATFKPQRGLDPELTLTVEQDQLTVTVGGGLVDDVAAAKASYFLVSGKFPALDKILRKALDAKPEPTESGFDWRHVAGFANAAGRVGLRVKSTGARSPLLITGDDFIGALMPRQIHDVADKGWDDLLSATEPETKEAVA